MREWPPDADRGARRSQYPRGGGQAISPTRCCACAEAAQDGSLGQTKDAAEAERLFQRARAEHGQPTGAAEPRYVTLNTNEPRNDAAALHGYRGGRRARRPRGLRPPGPRLSLMANWALCPTMSRPGNGFQTKAADLGDTGGALNLGAMLMLGRGGPVDEAAALALYRRAAEQGSATAEANIAGVYWVGTAGVPKDRAEAVRHYQIAAKGGNVVAERMLSVAYGTGDGIERDEVQQLDWARKAAEQGDAVSQNTVGYLILTGVGGSYDYVEAAMWLTLAAERAGSSGELHDLATENLHTAIACQLRL